MTRFLGSRGLLFCLLGAALLLPITLVSAANRIHQFVVNTENSIKALHGTAVYRTTQVRLIFMLVSSLVFLRPKAPLKVLTHTSTPHFLHFLICTPVSCCASWS